ncbi:hypothetical protein RRG08_001241 [Elysia crispata]|uniref:Secreted protein n=1 Tax=Elysia crispata TaxID=231223 RepID=A0AAE1B706_9GAST|nr:hypothetical protein RRG08_001241 [Elysia crispata]
MIETRLLAILLCLGSPVFASETKGPLSAPSLSRLQSYPTGSCTVDEQTIPHRENFTFFKGLSCQKHTCINSTLILLYKGCVHEGECQAFNLTFQGSKGDCFLYRCERETHYDERSHYRVPNQ